MAVIIMTITMVIVIVERIITQLHLLNVQITNKAKKSNVREKSEQKTKRPNRQRTNETR